MIINIVSTKRNSTMLRSKVRFSMNPIAYIPLDDIRQDIYIECPLHVNYKTGLRPDDNINLNISFEV